VSHNFASNVILNGDLDVLSGRNSSKCNYAFSPEVYLQPLGGNVSCFVSGLNVSNQPFLVSHNFASNVILKGSLYVISRRNSSKNNCKFFSDVYWYGVDGTAQSVTVNSGRKFECK